MSRGVPLPFIRWRGLTLQMFLIIILPLTLLLLGIAFGSTTLHHEAMRSLVGDRDLRTVRASAASLGRAIEHRALSLELLAYNAGGAPDSAAYLDKAAQEQGFDRGLVLYDSAGAVLARSQNAAPPVLDLAVIREHLDRAAQENGTAAPTTSLIADGSGGWLVAGAASGENGLLLAGAFTPTVVARESLAGIASDPAVLLLLSVDGDVLYHSGDAEHMQLESKTTLLEKPGVADVLRGESGVNYASAGLHGSDHSGEHVIAFAPVPPFGWGLVLEEPWEETASPLLRESQSAPLVLAPALVLTLVALWFGVRQVVQPLQALEERAALLTDGNFSAIRQPVGGISEIRSLQDELVEMTAALQLAQEALHGYIGALTAGVENERRSLARELHDDTLQALIALNQHVQLAMLRAQDPAQEHQLGELQASVAQTIASLRRAIGGLRPIYLEDLGLVAALSMLAQEAGKNHAITVTFDLRGKERRLPPETELAFYRITQEAINNAAHHARPRKVVVSLAFEDHGVRLSISDDGQGFVVPQDAGAFARLGHYGLLGMHERAEMAKVDLKIESATGKGTRVSLFWPESAEEAARPALVEQG